VASSNFRTSTSISGVIIVVCLLLAGFLLLFGVANLIHPDVPPAYHAQNTLVCAGVCALGLVLLFIAVVGIRRLVRQAGTQRPGAAP
jgi:small-conductance mechanosensitive channel